jgi:DNA-binding MarR family transcriptional regulator
MCNENSRIGRMKDKPALSLEEFLPYRLNRLADAVSRDFARIYRDRHGMTRPEWRLLATLGQFGRVTAKSVGEHSAMHKTKVSRAVRALEERRWLVRNIDPDDRRVEQLELTQAGRKVYRELVPLAKSFEAQLLARMDGEDAETLLVGLKALEKVALGRDRPEE